MSIPSNPGNIFLTTLNHTGDIYSPPPSHSETNVPPTMDRLQFDNTLLVRKEKESDSSRLIHTLREDLSAMKEKMKLKNKNQKLQEIFRILHHVHQQLAIKLLTLVRMYIIINGNYILQKIKNLFVHFSD